MKCDLLMRQKKTKVENSEHIRISMAEEYIMLQKRKKKEEKNNPQISITEKSRINNKQ